MVRPLRDTLCLCLALRIYSRPTINLKQIRLVSFSFFLPAHLHTHKKTHSKVVLRDGMKLSTFSMKLLKIDEMRGAREERTEQ